MSDNARRFHSVRRTLLRTYPAASSSRRLNRHLTTLSALIAGLVASGSTHLTKIAQKVPDHTKADSRAKRFTRWLTNKAVTTEGFYLPWARQLAASLCEGRRLVVVFDGSGLGRGCATLMACLVYRRRALPLCWTTKRGAKGSFSVKDHLALVEQVKALLPESASVVFLGDGEFDSIELLEALDRAGWQYACRTARSRRVSDGYTECAIGELRPVFGQGWACLPEAFITEAAYGPVQVVCWHEQRYREPIYLVTNLELAQEAIFWYRRRFRIETLFSDQKSRGFHVHKSHISDPERLSRLLIVVALAYLWVIYLGAEALKRKLNRMVHRSDRVDLSLFQLGLRLLEYLLNQGRPILVAFCPPTPQTVR